MKKFLFLFILIFLLFPLTSSALNIYHVKVQDVAGVTDHVVQYEGIVPCGRCATTSGDFDKHTSQVIYSITDTDECARKGFSWRDGGCHWCKENQGFIPCTFCHIFVMINGIISFILLTLVPPVATIIFMAGALFLYFSAGDPEKVNKAKKILTSAIIGIIIIYTSWIIISEALKMAGVADWVGFGSGWYQINCEIALR